MMLSNKLQCARVCVPLALIAWALLTSPVHGATVTVKVSGDGSFGPRIAYIHDGDTVQWELANPRADSIIPVASGLTLEQSPGLAICSKYKAYAQSGANEFTGPLPHAPPGIFVLGPDEGLGLVVKSGAAQCNTQNHPECSAAVVGSGPATQCLCAAGKPYAAMDATWGDPDIAGVFIRLPWNAVHKGPGKFYWDDLDREIGKAVNNGKLYSLAFRAGSGGTPQWIFSPLTQTATTPTSRARKRGSARIADNSLPQAVVRRHFRDGGSKLEPGECGPPAGMDLGSPADANYRKYYFELLSAVATHLKEKNAWYRALAYIKPAGLNLISSENRLPNSCEPGCLCNPEVWATQGSAATRYTPSALKQFYEEQFKLLAEEFPDKDLSYALIQAGFPQVNDHGEYLGKEGVPAWTGAQVPKDKCSFPPKGILPGGTQQTECILQVGKTSYGKRFVVQHNGLGPLCDAGAEDALEDGCLPNKWAKDAGTDGHIIGYQTNNAAKVGSAAQLEAAFQNGYCNAEATFFEIYEPRLWEVRMKTGGVLDEGALGSAIAGCKLPIASNRSFASWDAMLTARREQRSVDQGFLMPFAKVHTHRFSRTVNGSATQLLHYVHGAKCEDGAQPKYGVVAILPTVTTNTAPPTTSAVSGYQEIVPSAGKPTNADVLSRALVSTDHRLALRGISLGEDAGSACLLSLAFQDLPGPAQSDTTLAMTTTWSGAETCGAPAASIKTAQLTGASQFVRGVSVCTSGLIPQVRGIRVHGATVSDAGGITNAAQTATLTLGGCSSWQPTRYCPTSQVAVGVKAYFTAAGGYTGIALQCKGVEAR